MKTARVTKKFSEGFTLVIPAYGRIVIPRFLAVIQVRKYPGPPQNTRGWTVGETLGAPTRQDTIRSKTELSEDPFPSPPRYGELAVRRPN